MSQERRWFTETDLGEILDGPFRKERDAIRAAAQHAKLYRYTPVVAFEDIDLGSVRGDTWRDLNAALKEKP